MLSRMSSAEFAEWMAFANIEPFGSHVEDRRAGAAVSMLANVHRDTKQHPEPFDDLHFFPWNDLTRQAMAPRESELLQVEDPEKMSDLIGAVLFGEAPQPKE